MKLGDLIVSSERPHFPFGDRHAVVIRLNDYGYVLVRTLSGWIHEWHTRHLKRVYD